MGSVLETPARPDTPEARAAGNVALAAALAAVTVLVTTAAGSLLRPPAQATAVTPSRPLPFVAQWTAAGAGAWHGAAIGPRGIAVATGNANGAVATIVGGGAWRDYTLRARVRWVSGRAMSFHVRETGSEDFVSCVLDGATARIDEVSGGVIRTLAEGPAPAYMGKAFDAVVVVRGRDVAFAVDGATVAGARVRTAMRGTAGIATWDPQWGKGLVESEYVRVEPVTVPAPMPPEPRTIVTRPSVQAAGGEE